MNPKPWKSRILAKYKEELDRWWAEMIEEEPECNGICLWAADIGVPEAGNVVAYAHPDCPEHGNPQEYDPSEETCGGGDEHLRYVREEDIDS